MAKTKKTQKNKEARTSKEEQKTSPDNLSHVEHIPAPFGYEGPNQGILQSEKLRQLFAEIQGQLTIVLEQIEHAAGTIMEAAEHQFSKQHLAEEAFSQLQSDEHNEALDSLKNLQADLDVDLNTILMALSFQDLTGQRLKKSLTILQDMEKILSEHEDMCGLQKAEATQSANMQEIADINKEVVGSELKGPSEDGNNQDDTDALLKQLGIG